MTNHFLNNTTNSNTPEKTCAWTLLLDTIVWPTVANGYGDHGRRNMEVQLHDVQDGFACSQDATVKNMVHGNSYEEKSSYVMQETPRTGDVVQEGCERACDELRWRFRRAAAFGLPLNNSPSTGASRRLSPVTSRDSRLETTRDQIEFHREPQ